MNDPLASNKATGHTWLWVMGTTLLVYLAMGVFYNTPALCSSRFNRELFVWPVWIALILTYLKGCQVVLQAEQSGQTISGFQLIASTVVLALLTLWIPPFHSTDVFGYINRGWQQVAYGLNPYVHTVNNIPHWQTDPMLTNHWVNNPSPYGFLYLQIAKGLTLLGQGQKNLTLLVFKLGNMVAYGSTLLLLLWGQKSLLSNTRHTHDTSLAPSREPSLSKQSFFSWRTTGYLFLWNPLLVVHGLINSHNDVWMGLLVTLAACCALRQKSWAILPSLMAASLIKYAALVTLPLAILYHLRQKQWFSLFVGLTLSLLVVSVTGHSYLTDWKHFNLLAIEKNAFVTHGSLHAMLYHSYQNLGKLFSPGEPVPHLLLVRSGLKTVLLGGYVLFYSILWGWRFFQKLAYTPGRFIQDNLLAMAILIGIVSLKCYPWYFGMFFPLIFLLPPSSIQLFWLFLLLTCSQLASLTFIGQAHILNFWIMTGFPLLWFSRSRLSGWRSFPWKH